MKLHRVYSKCWAGREVYLQVEKEGTRWECLMYIRNRVRANQPTHFLFISTLDIDRASRRYL